jgi:hypothetical protein
MTAKPSITLKAAAVSRCAAAQEMTEALRVLKQIADRLDEAPKLHLDSSEEKPAGEGNEGV